MDRNGGRPFELLLVEDSPGDVLLMREALRDVSIPVRLQVVEDGAAAIDYVRREGPFRGALQPDMILLDLNLPKVDGFEVLAAIKEDEGLCSIPVVVLTTSSSPEDIRRSYRLHCNSYITKPNDLGAFMAIVRVVTRYWFSTTRLASRAE